MSLITEVDILNEAKECFLTYSEEVLTDRAIPAAEDGLLSAQRKILWTMENYLKMDSKSKTKKCNALVGSTLATSYFHGDAACYGVLCKMSQDYLMRYPLIKGQGSLGTQENNDMVASSRYTEAKPSIYADLMFNDFKKKVVPMKETYNGEFMEPVVLPSEFPNAICNGRQAIGISMSHNSAPHNLIEVCDAIIAYINNNDLTIDELLTYLPGPDFPLGGTIINKQDIKTAFATGHSAVSLKVRGDYEIDGQKIIFTTIPYRTYRNKIKEQIEKNIDIFNGLLDDFDDASSIGQNKLIFYVKKDISPATVLKKLFALTDLQSTISYNMNYIVNGTPKMCSMLDLIKYYVEHQENILVKATLFDKEKAEARAHILKGLVAAVDKIDEVIKLIKESISRNDAENKLINFLTIDKIQADAILDMRLGKLTKIDKEELINELQEKLDFIQECIKILNTKELRNKILIEKVQNLKNKYGDARRTKLAQMVDDSKEPKEEVYIEPEKCVVIMTEGGSIKRVPITSFRTQNRGGKGVKTQDDITNSIIRTNTIDSLMIFTNKGNLYRLTVADIPVGTNSSKGVNIKSLVEMQPGENASIIYSIYKDTDAKYVLFTTKNGIVKKTSLEEYALTRKKTGMSAIKLKDNDEIASVNLIKDEEIIIITSGGYCLRYNSTDIAIQGRNTVGVKGVKLGENDYVLTTLVIRENTDDLGVFTSSGLGKRICLKEVIKGSRGNKGIYIYKPQNNNDKVAGATLINDMDNLLISGTNKSICVSAKEISKQSRTAQGVTILKDNVIQSVSKI